MLSAVSQTENDKYCMTSLTCGIKLNNKKQPPPPPQKKKQIHRKRAQICGYQKRGGSSELEEGGQKVETSSYKINTGDVMYVMTA